MPSDEDVDYVSVEEASSSLVASKEVDLEKEGEEEYLNFSKDSKAEYSNSYTDNVTAELTKEEINYIKDNIDGFEDSYEMTFSYSRDLFVSSKMEQIEQNIVSKIKQACDEHEVEYNGNGEVQEMDEYNLSNLEVLGNNKISFELTYNVTEYENSDW